MGSFIWAAGRGASVTRVTLGSIARDRGDHSCYKIHLADEVVSTIRKVKVAGTVERNVARIRFNCGAHSQAAVPGVTAGSIACDCCYHTGGGCDLPNALAIFVGDINIACAIDAQTSRIVQLAACGLTSVAGITRRTISGDCADHAGADSHLSDDRCSR